MITQTERPQVELAPRPQTQARIAAAAWGTFFLWMALVFLLSVSAPIAFVGVGVITLVAQGARRAFRLPLEGFWLVMGLCFAIGGLLAWLAPQLPIVPILLVVVAVALITEAVRRRS